MAVTYKITDNKDGATANIVIAGLGSELNFWFFRFAALRTDEWVLLSPTEKLGADGTFTWLLTLPGPGVYWSWIHYPDGFTTPVIFEITDGSLPFSQQIANAVVNLINSQVALPDSAMAKRTYVPGFTLEQIQTLQVSVVCRSLTTQPDNREVDDQQYLVEIGVQRKLDYASDEDPVVDSLNQTIACDPWTKLCETIESTLRKTENRRLSNGAYWVGDESTPLYDYETLDQQQQFNALIVATYQIDR